MEDKKKVALDDELLDKVAGGGSGPGLFWCPNCNYRMQSYESCECPKCKKAKMLCIG